MLAHVLHAQAVQVVHGGAQSDDLGDRLRARLELPREIVVRRALGADRLDHVAAGHERLHALEQLAAAVEDAGARGPEHLVPAEGVEVATERPHVNWLVGRALRAVHKYGRASLLAFDAVVAVDAADGVDAFGEDDPAVDGEVEDAELVVVEHRPLALEVRQDVGQADGGLHADVVVDASVLVAEVQLERLPGWHLEGLLGEVGVLCREREHRLGGFVLVLPLPLAAADTDAAGQLGPARNHLRHGLGSR